MLTVFIRSLILYLVIIALLRAMGKRQIGQMQPYEFVITLMIADFAAAPLDGVSTSLFNGLMPIMALVLTNSVLSILIYKSQKFRRFVSGKPAVLIHNGRIQRNELDKQALAISDLLEQVRLAGYPDIGEIGVAILEPSGQMSVFPISEKRPVTTQEMKVKTGYETVPLTLIVDGKVQKENLNRGKVTEIWLKQQLKKMELSEKEILLLTLSSQGVLRAQLHQSNAPMIYRQALNESEVCW